MSTTAVKIGLVGTGAGMAEAIDILRTVPIVEIAAVVDSNDRSEGARLAKRLKLPLEVNCMAVFRTEANLILEVSGDDRLYESLLSIKPPGVEVMSVHGTAFLLQLLKLLGEKTELTQTGNLSRRREHTLSREAKTSREFKLTLGVILGLAGVALPITSLFLEVRSGPSEFVVPIVVLLLGLGLLRREVPEITREGKLKLGITLTLVGLALPLIYLPFAPRNHLLVGGVLWTILQHQSLFTSAVICFFVGLGLMLFGIAERSQRGR